MLSNVSEAKPRSPVDLNWRPTHVNKILHQTLFHHRYTLLTDQTIQNRIQSKVCCDVFTCRIRTMCINQHRSLHSGKKGAETVSLGALFGYP